MYQYIKKNKRLTEKEAFHVFMQIVEALKEMQAKNIVHRDLKLDNVLLTHSNLEQAQIKIADFGLSDISVSKGKPKLLTSKCGTPGFTIYFQYLLSRYMAPEIFSNRGYNDKVDIFSSGIILFTL